MSDSFDADVGKERPFIAAAVSPAAKVEALEQAVSEMKTRLAALRGDPEVRRFADLEAPGPEGHADGHAEPGHHAH